MKILLTLNSSNYGGIEKTVLDLAKGLSNGHEVIIVCPNGDYAEEYKRYSKVINYKKITKIDLKYILFLTKILKKEKIDVIHANDPRIVFNSLLAGFLSKTKVRISHTHTPISDWQIPEFSKKINIFMNSIIVNLFSDYEICLTEYIRRIKIEEGISPGKLFVINNCLDNDFVNLVNKFSDRSEVKKNKKFTFLCVSRFTIEKNQIHLLEAFYELSKLYKEVNLKLIGKGPLLGECKNFVSSKNLTDRVTFENDLTEEEKVREMIKADAFVFPTLAEGFGLVMIEAMTTTKFVLVSDLPVLREVSDSRIIYFKKNDTLDLLKKMLEVFENKLESNFIENREFVLNKYSFENYINSYERLYTSKL